MHPRLVLSIASSILILITRHAVMSIKLIGGRLCLDFANAVDWRVGSHPVELIDDFSDLVAWSRRVDIVTDLEADRLLAEAANCPEEAAAALAKAIELREAIFLIFSSIVKGMEPNGDDLSLLNENLAQASSRLRVVPVAGGFRFEWNAGDNCFDRVIWPIVRSAAELLVSEDMKKLRMCEGNDCGWLFVDTS